MQKKSTGLIVGILIFIMSMTVYADEIIPTNIIRNDLENGAKEIIKVYELDRKAELQVDINGFFEEETQTQYDYVTTETQEIVETDEKETTHTASTETSGNDKNSILAKFDETIEHTTDDGYVGTLTIDKESLTTKTKGYSSKQYQVTESRTYPNLPNNDVAFIPKNISVGGYNLTLSNVNWVYNTGYGNGIVANTYSANTTYVRTATATNPTGYVSTVTYKGLVTKNTKDVIEYKVRFQSDEVPTDETDVEDVEDEKTNEKDQTDENANAGSLSIVGLVVFLIFFLAIIIVLIIVYVKFFHHKVKDALDDMKMRNQIKQSMMNDIDLDEDEYSSDMKEDSYDPNDDEEK